MARLPVMKTPGNVLAPNRSSLIAKGAPLHSQYIPIISPAVFSRIRRRYLVPLSCAHKSLA